MSKNHLKQKMVKLDANNRQTAAFTLFCFLTPYVF